MGIGLDIHSVLRIVDGKVACIENGKRKEYASSTEASDAYGAYYVIDSISVEGNTFVLQIHDRRPEIDAEQSKFLKEYRQKNGKEFSFFDC